MSVEVAGPSLESIDLTDPELFRHGFPHEVFTVLREQTPVWRHPATPGTEELGGSFWVVSTHAELEAVSHNTAGFSSYEGPSIPGWDEMGRGNMLIAMDPPDHTRLRRLVNTGFTPRMTAKLEDQARTRAAGIVDEALEKGECNFVEEVAYQLPMHMIADIVGIPVGDRHRVFEVITRAIDAQSPGAGLTPDDQAMAMGEMFGYAHELAEAKRRSPQDDVWTTLTTAEIEQPDGTTTQLSEIELDLFFMILTIAGSETTRDAISSGLVALLDHPDQFERMRTDPSVMDTAVEEIVRWASPVTYFRRTAVEDTVLGGEAIAAGDRVTLWYPSANRDALVFKDPFRFDITRDPNPHVGYGGHGVHYCLGANLARREIRVMFQELLARVGRIELIGEQVRRVNGISVMIADSLRDLPVRLTPR